MYLYVFECIVYVQYIIYSFINSFTLFHIRLRRSDSLFCDDELENLRLASDSNLRLASDSNSLFFCRLSRRRWTARISWTM